MRFKMVFDCAVACSVMISATVGSFSAAKCNGDINGDYRVDIRDVQTLLSEMLSGVIPENEADVNTDGQIDVCDLQFMLAQINVQPFSKEPAPLDDKTPCAILVAAVRYWMRADTGAVEILRPDTCETRLSLRSHDEPLVVLPTHTERYLFTLTENAPPSPA